MSLVDPGPILHVDDDGLPRGERSPIFAHFARLPGTNGSGSGLGLALIAQQARHHAADVEIGDSPLGGARFTVTFR